MKNFFRKYFRKDNQKFIIELFTTLCGFVVTNFSLIKINNGLNVLNVGLGFVSLVCFVCMLLLILHKYQYYRGLVEHLRQKNKQLFLICSYISKVRKYRNREKTNNFIINNMNVIYDVNAPPVFTHSEGDVDFSVTYEINAINNGGKCSKIHHFSLSKGNNSGVSAEYRIENGNTENMKIDSSFLLDNNLQLWYAIKTGNPFEHLETFNYSIKVNYKNGFRLLKDNYFLIDPQNYGVKVDKINIIVRSNKEELKKLIGVPVLTTYYNGLNTNDKDGQIAFEEKSNDVIYKTYFHHTVKPSTDDVIYVLEMAPKFLSNEIS